MTTCRSRSKFGDCSLPAGHDPELHAVLISTDKPGGSWFAYKPRGRGAVGYGQFRDGEFVPWAYWDQITAEAET